MCTPTQVHTNASHHDTLLPAKHINQAMHSTDTSLKPHLPSQGPFSGQGLHDLSRRFFRNNLDYRIGDNSCTCTTFEVGAEDGCTQVFLPEQGFQLLFFLLAVSIPSPQKTHLIRYGRSPFLKHSNNNYNITINNHINLQPTYSL